MFRQGRLRVLALWLADALCIVSVWACVVVVYWLLGGGYLPSMYLRFWPTALVFLFANGMMGLYNGSWAYPAAPIPPVEEMRRLTLSSALAHFGTIAVIVLMHQTMLGYSRAVMVISGILTAILAQSFRNWFRWLLLKCGVGQLDVVLAGGGKVAEEISQILHDDPYTGFHILGYFDGVHSEVRRLKNPAVPYLGQLGDIVPYARRNDVKILLACQDERLFGCQMEEFTSWFTYIEYLPTASVFPVFGAKAVTFDGIGGLEMVNQGRKKLFRAQKRVLDTLMAIFAFILVSPLFIVIPILVKLTSDGCVFYRQDRLGKGGRPIRVWKFRSMYKDADERLQKLLAAEPGAAEEWRRNMKLRHDPRITPLGKFLRMTSLDELPQLFNVFLGDMSLIGPRPIVKAEVAKYGDSYRVFSSVRPGITGLWQVSGRSNTDYTRRIALDTYYVMNWSPWMDWWILLRTVYVVLLMRGAR